MPSLQVLKRIDKAPRIVPITVGSPAVGGARRVGLELIGLSSTGVFIDEVSADRGDLRKGDQVLQVDDHPVGEWYNSCTTCTDCSLKLTIPYQLLWCLNEIYCYRRVQQTYLILSYKLPF